MSDDYGRASDDNKYFSDSERRALNHHVTEDVSFKLLSVYAGKMLKGVITGGEFTGHMLSLRVSPDVIQEIFSRPDVAPHLEGTAYKPVEGAVVDGKFYPHAAAQAPNGQVVAIALETVPAQDPSKTLDQAIRELPVMQISKMQLDMSIIPGQRLERRDLLADAKGEITFKDKPSDGPAQKTAVCLAAKKTPAP